MGSLHEILCTKGKKRNIPGPRGPNTIREIQTSMVALDKLLEDNKYGGYEPFDGLSSYLTLYEIGEVVSEFYMILRIKMSAVYIGWFNNLRRIDKIASHF